ncbi:MAG: penicillin-binding protein 2 [Rhodobacteraceae bacterium]|nr:penicillin-binding protein 2 [Paracoccaceae bacterium]
MRRLQKAGTLRQYFTRRALILAGMQAGVIGALGWQMRRITVKQNQSFRLLAEENRINIRLIPPVRGLVFDRLGKPLAYNQPNYKIEMVREQSDDPEGVLQRLATIVPITDKHIAQALEEMRIRRGFVPVTVTQDLDWAHIAAVSANAPALPGITPELGHYRIYPQADDFAHIMGYVGPVSDYDLSKTNDDDPLLLIPRFQIGKNGVEKQFEKPLRGKAGMKRIEVNSIGRVMRVLGREESKAGANVQLTIDHRLQKYALKRLGDESGSAVIMDVHNGDLLAVASAPSFDPNKFVRGISVADFRNLNENKFKPMLNKAVSGTYPPGSTFKMVTALAALRGGFITNKDQYNCSGSVELYSRKFHCWNRSGHGDVALRDSLKRSCDVYYYEVAQKVGIENISAMARDLGIGIEHDLQLPAVRSGLAPTKEWKKRVRKKDWTVGDTLNASIGQGFVLASPLQLAVMTARIGTGTKIEPRLVNAISNIPQAVKGREPLDIESAHLDAVRDGMFSVVNEKGGTAAGSRLPGRTKMSGKTGTTQVIAITERERLSGVVRNENRKWEHRDHALFVAYAPADNPRIAISVVVEHGGGGSKVAAPIAKDILQRALELVEDNDYRALPTDIPTDQLRRDDKS